jgi:hypothetical protein
MTVKELIKELKKLPQDARVFHLWDGEPRTAINIVYKSKNGRIITSDFDMVCYPGSARPLDAPIEEEDRYWHTDKAPEGYNWEDDDY